MEPTELLHRHPANIALLAKQATLHQQITLLAFLGLPIAEMEMQGILTPFSAMTAILTMPYMITLPAFDTNLTVEKDMRLMIVISNAIHAIQIMPKRIIVAAFLQPIAGLAQ